MHRELTVSALAFLLAAGSSRAGSERVLAEWKFDARNQWNGWTPGGLIRNVSFQDDGVRFDAAGSDPIIVGPPFELTPAANDQWVVVDLESNGPGQGELFYTNKTTGRYGGFEPKWMISLTVPQGGRQSITAWPFWSSLGKIIRLRFDPPPGTGLKLRAIRVVEMAGDAPKPSWEFKEQEDSWRAMYAAELMRTDEGLKVKAAFPQAVIITPVEPFDAARMSILQLEADCPGEESVTLYWGSREDEGLFGRPVPTGPSTRRSAGLDLRRFAEWKGTITHLAIAFGTRGGEVLALKSLSLAANDPSRSFLRARYIDFDRGVVRQGQQADVRLILEHGGGPGLPAGQAKVACGENLKVFSNVVALPAIEPGGRAEVRLRVAANGPGDFLSVETANGQSFTTMLRVEPPIGDPGLLARPDGYDVPPAKPIATDYRIGVYYFPGWSPDQMSRWSRQAAFPERDPLLGWYEEGRPEVADWQIKWAVENGISFFIYDWYWRNGKEELAAGLNEGFLKARYRHLMKFAIMWANHRPFDQHTPEQLLKVADYWIERYLRQPNYLLVDGKPYVSFFVPGQLIQEMGSEENVREAFEAMREKARQAGLAGIHFAGCTGSDPGILDSLRRAGFDSVTAYNYVRLGTVLDQSPYRHYMLAHEKVWQAMGEANVLPYIPLLTVNWDARPWHGPRTNQKFGRASHHFAEGLERLKSHLDQTGGKTAILEAWNEWGEGSYLEPNVQFGFGDLEAVRNTFGKPGAWPANVCPHDVGLEGKYDLRRKRLTTRSAHPDVADGLELICRGDRLVVTPGTFRLRGRTHKSGGGEVVVPPLETWEVKDLPVELVGGEVRSWRGGNRLVIGREDLRNVLPGSYVAGSLTIRDPAQPQAVFSSPGDYAVDDLWGAFALTSAGRLRPGRHVAVTYRISLRRVDALVIEPDGQPRLIKGEASPDCPELPKLPPGTLHLANIYRPYHAGELRAADLFIPGRNPSPSAVSNIESLRPVLGRLRNGKNVTIVCWGDSVTAGGDASSPQQAYVGLLDSMLHERFPSATIRVINAGIGGSNTAGRLPNFQREVLDQHPDVVTLEFVNDMNFPLEQMQQRYTEILKRTRQAGAALVLITPHFTRPDWMGLEESRCKADPRPNVAFLRGFARENKVPLADAVRRWEELEGRGIPYEILLRNGINHPDDRGHRFFAEALMRLFE